MRFRRGGSRFWMFVAVVGLVLSVLRFLYGSGVLSR